MQKHIDDDGDSVMIPMEPYGAKLVHFMLSKEKCKSSIYTHKGTLLKCLFVYLYVVLILLV